MKSLLILLISVVFFTSCSKKNSKATDDCVAVIVTQLGTPCGQWGIKINSNTYPSNNIPSQFQQEGLTVCANYDLFDDARACACCGGTWADVKTMKTFVR